MIKLTTLLNEQNDSNEKIETQELADHFRNWLIEEDSGLTRFDFLMTPSQAKKAGNWDDLNKLWALPGVRNRYAMDAQGWIDANAIGVNAGSSTEDLEKTRKLKVTEDGWNEWTLLWILLLAAAGTGIAAALWKGKKVIVVGARTALAGIKKLFKKKITNETLSTIPAEQDLMQWVKSEQMAALNADRRKMPKYMYDELQSNLAKDGVRALIEKEVILTCLSKVTAGTMNAKLLVKKLPTRLQYKYGAAIEKAGAGYTKQAQKAAAAKAAKDAPRRRPIGF
tara:strand:+ start:1193 stop:2035 length:843 start_codon:yes stop_codon:yes gene_type:complete